MGPHAGPAVPEQSGAFCDVGRGEVHLCSLSGVRDRGDAAGAGAGGVW